MLDLIVVFFVAIPIGVFGIVFGGNMFLSLPFFQWFFPEMTLGAIIGNIKPGSVVRNISGLIPLHKKRRIDYKKTAPLVAPLLLGSIIGSAGIIFLSEKYIIPILISGWLVMHYAAWIAPRISKTGFLVGTTIVGVYGGIFGAGVSLLIVALLRLRITENIKFVDVRANALFLETVLTVFSVGVFLSFGLIQWQVATIWAAGAMLGGYIGGVILHKTGKMNPIMQRGIVHCAFAIAVTVALWRLW